jgi:hypothetical protein
MTKSFKVSAVNPDGSHFFSISQSGAAKVNVPVAANEMTVIRTLAAFLVPRLLGFDMVCDGMHTMHGQGTGPY